MKWLPLLILLFAFLNGISQDPKKIAVLEAAIKKAKTDEEKVSGLGLLAEYYQLYKLDKLSDSLLDQQIFVAEFSRDKELLFKALFNPTIVNIGSWTPKNTFDHAIKLLQKSLQYAQSQNKRDYAALANIRLAGIYRKRGKYDEAQKQITLAYSALGDRQTDSVTLLLHLESGDIFTAIGDALPAFENYSTALDISYKIDNIRLRSETHHHMADLYRSLNDKVAAKNQLLTSVELNEENNNSEGLLMDYIDLGRLTEEKEYIEKAAILADKIGSEKYQLYVKRLMFSWYMVKGGNEKVTRAYLSNNQDLSQYFKNQGPENYYWTLGNIYKYSDQLDSSIFCFKCAEVALEKSYDDFTKMRIYNSLADTYLKNSDTPNAMIYYEKGYALAKNKNLPSFLPSITDTLGILHASIGNYAKAYAFSLEAKAYKKEFYEKSSKDKLALIDLKNSEKEKEDKDSRRHNLQYIAITLAIGIIFLSLLLLGMFPITHFTIKIFGFISFVSLFEFFVLLIDKFLHDITHGEPIKIWLCKVVIIAMMVPFQHFLEHKMVQYLASRKLLVLRKNLVLSAFHKKKPTTTGEDITISKEKENDLTQD